VLLLEDDDDARSIYRDMLGYAGFEVVAACDGIEGLRYAEARRPDVVVTDLHMPGMNGIEVAKTLRASDEPTPPLIAVTADSLGIRAAEPRTGGEPLFDEVLVKPVTPGELVRKVRLYVSPPEGDAA
jgi:CheY-like chemotaxis protein